METGKQKVKVKNHLLGQKDRKKKERFQHKFREFKQ